VAPPCLNFFPTSRQPNPPNPPNAFWNKGLSRADSELVGRIGPQLARPNPLKTFQLGGLGGLGG
jgi:hypothetical protein